MINLGKNCNLNIEKLIATRMLIAANSGGGKSWTLRRFLEQSNGQVQQIILDLEGEFISLREEYDYLLVGEDGEIPVSIRTAEILARKLLELNVSTIIDLSELRHPERITFVKRFLDSLINAPKKLWHPAIIVIDEAHVFCPQKEKAESMGSVIDLMTRGRKRGFCGVLATQRLPKLNKDASAECNNLILGRASQDIDQKRMGDILGITDKKEIRNFKYMAEGEVYCEGPAFEHDGVNKFQIGGINTTHPDRTKGIVIKKNLPIPENIKKIMKDLVDLPKEAEKELKTTKEMKDKIRELKTKLTISEHSKQKPLIKVDEKALERAELMGTKRAEDHYLHEIKKLKMSYRAVEKILNGYVRHIKQGIDSSSKLLQIEIPEIKEIKSITSSTISSIKTEPFNYVPPVTNSHHQSPLDTEISMDIQEEKQKLQPAYMRMLKSCASYFPDKITKQKLSILSNVSRRNSTFRSGLSKLKILGLINVSDMVICTEEGLEIAGDFEDIPRGDPQALFNIWMSKLQPAYARMFKHLFEIYPESISKDDLSMASDVDRENSTFRSGLSKLKTLGLIEVNGNVKISEEFFE